MPKSEIELEIENQNKQRPSLYVNVKKPAEYDNALNEHVITSDLNTHIILGGKTQNNPDIAKATYNSTITLISGMGTAIKNKPPKLSEAGKLCFSPQYYYDSAVLQICEQTNVDANFGARIVDQKAENRSAIALKADEVRLFSRGTVKIITGIDQRDTPLPPNSRIAPPSQQNADFSGIHLIANNSAETVGELHPIVLGRNLEEFLNKILDEINKIHSVIQKLTDLQSVINDSVREHTHLSDFTAKELLRGTDPALVTPIVLNNSEIKKLINIDNSTLRVPNIENLRKTYLSSNQNTYINSIYNKTN
jgi:hypothetical protein